MRKRKASAFLRGESLLQGGTQTSFRWLLCTLILLQVHAAQQNVTSCLRTRGNTKRGILEYPLMMKREANISSEWSHLEVYPYNLKLSTMKFFQINIFYRFLSYCFNRESCLLENILFLKMDFTHCLWILLPVLYIVTTWAS